MPEKFYKKCKCELLNVISRGKYNWKPNKKKTQNVLIKLLH